MTAFFAKQLQANDRSDLMPEFWYYWMPKDETTKSNVTAVMKNLKIEPTTEYAQSAQIAYESLHLGTVIHLLSEQKQFSDEWHFWTYVVKDIFPYYKQSLGHGSRRERIFQALRRVNTLRNNIFHFDPAFMFDDVFGGPNHERYKIDARYLHAVTAWLSVPTKLLLDQMVALLNTPLAAKAGEESPLPLDLNKVFIEFEKMEQVEKTINNKKERSRR